MSGIERNDGGDMGTGGDLDPLVEVRTSVQGYKRRWSRDRDEKNELEDDNPLSPSYHDKPHPELSGETQEQLWDVWEARRNMAFVALGSVLAITLLVFGIAIFTKLSDSRLKIISDMLDMFYIGMVSIVGAYMGFRSWVQKKNG